MKDAVRDPAELCRPGWPAAAIPRGGPRAARDFTVFVPRRWIARMRYGDTRDPLLLQVLPLAEELQLAGRVHGRPGGRPPGRAKTRVAF